MLKLMEKQIIANEEQQHIQRGQALRCLVLRSKTKNQIQNKDCDLYFEFTHKKK
jgi:hypothetical protein